MCRLLANWLCENDNIDLMAIHNQACLAQNTVPPTLTIKSWSFRKPRLVLVLDLAIGYHAFPSFAKQNGIKHGARRNSRWGGASFGRELERSYSVLHS